MARREFPKQVKVAVIRRATRDMVVYCEKCGLPAKRWQIDHVIPDGLGGEPVIENAELICDVCYGLKNPDDTRKIAKAKRIEAKRLGVCKPSTLQSRGFQKSVKERRGKIEKLANLPPPPLLRETK